MRPGRVWVARARGRVLRRLGRNRELGETMLPRRAALLGDELPTLVARRARLRVVPGTRPTAPGAGRSRSSSRTGAGPSRGPSRVGTGRPLDVVADGPVDDVGDEAGRSGVEDVDGGADERRDGPAAAAGRPVTPGGPGLLPPRPERDEHDWESGPPGAGARRPVLPGWVWAPWPAVTWWLGARWHGLRFHGARVPLYVYRSVAWTPRGVVRVVVGAWRWCTDAEGRDLRWWATEQLDVDGYLHLSRQRNERVRVRTGATTLAAAGLLVVGIVAWTDPAARALLVVVVVAVGGWFGRPADRALLEHPVVAPSGVRITPDLLVEAFCAAKMCNKHDDPDRHQTISFLAPVTRDGKGWRALLDLPGGHTASQAVSRKERVAAGLGIDEVRVFIDRVRGDDGSARRVTMWVADKDPYAAKPQVSPLVTAESWNFWDGVPFGTDARGRRVVVPMLFTSTLTGAIPRQGKTYAARIPAAAAALDPGVRQIIFDGKGGADWRVFELVAYRCGFGPRDPVVAHLVEVLDECLVDMERRYDTLGQLALEVCPESKITPAICANRRLAMPPVLISIDEIQEFLGHPDYGSRILEQLIRLAKVGPAVGIMLNLATQRPTTEVIDADLRDNIGTRFALKTMTYQNSDAILGAGSYSAGLDASRFLKSHKGVGILVGADDGELAEEGPQTVRTDLLDRAGIEHIVRRSRALREAAGTLEGAAVGEQLVNDNAATRNLLDDVAAVFGAGEQRLWSETICARLTGDHPELYAGWGPAELATMLATHGIDTGQVWAKDDRGVGRNRRGVQRQHVLDALAARADQPPSARDVQAPNRRRPARPGATPSGTPGTAEGPPGALAPRASLAPQPARSSTPPSDPDQGTSDLAPPPESPDLPTDPDSAPGPLDASPEPEPFDRPRPVTNQGDPSDVDS